MLRSVTSLLGACSLEDAPRPPLVFNWTDQPMTQTVKEQIKKGDYSILRNGELEIFVLFYRGRKVVILSLKSLNVKSVFFGTNGYKPIYTKLKTGKNSEKKMIRFLKFTSGAMLNGSDVKHYFKGTDDKMHVEKFPALNTEEAVIYKVDRAPPKRKSDDKLPKRTVVESDDEDDATPEQNSASDKSSATQRKRRVISSDDEDDE